MLANLSRAQRHVMETVWRMGPIARHEIARVTGLTGASITRLTRDLEELGLVSDKVIRDGARGQPARPVSLAEDGAYALGVNFSHTYLDVGLVNLVGSMVAHERLPLADLSPSSIARLAREGLDTLRMRSKVALTRIVGAGFSVPGDFRPTGRFNAHAYFPDLADQDLRAIFSAQMPIPVAIENDAACAALGERIHGAGVDLETFILVHIGHGVGSGWILEGRLFRGAHDNAGMIGVNFPMTAPRPSGQDLFATLAAEGFSAADFDALDEIDLQHPVVRKWITRAGAQLATGLYAITRAVDPQAVILGGRLPPQLQAALFAAMPLESILAQDSDLPQPRILQSALGANAGVTGAAAICFFQTFFAQR